MKHQFGQGFGVDAFNLFMRNRGFYLGDLSGANTNYSPGGGMNPMMMMMMMQMMSNGGGGEGMAQILPMLMQGGNGGMGGMGGGNNEMNNMMMAMMMSQMQKEQEKKDKQSQFDQMMNMMMLKMIGGSMDSRNPMDSGSGQFMVQEILDKDGRSVKERHNIPVGLALSNPMLMQGILGKNEPDQTTQMILKNALDEKSRAWEMMAAHSSH